jgi:hypothetical protein
MFDGDNPDAWIGPWVADTILGLAAPLLAYLAWRRIGPRVWGALLAYNAVGALDYGHGLATQWVHPQTGPEAPIYVWIGAFLTVQLLVLAALFRRDVIHHYLGGDTQPSAS